MKALNFLLEAAVKNDIASNQLSFKAQRLKNP